MRAIFLAAILMLPAAIHAQADEKNTLFTLSLTDEASIFTGLSPTGTVLPPRGDNLFLIQTAFGYRYAQRWKFFASAAASTSLCAKR